VVQLYPQALGTHFSRLLRHAWVTVGLFFNPGHHTGMVGCKLYIKWLIIRPISASLNIRNLFTCWKSDMLLMKKCTTKLAELGTSFCINIQQVSNEFILKYYFLANMSHCTRWSCINSKITSDTQEQTRNQNVNGRRPLISAWLSSRHCIRTMDYSQRYWQHQLSWHLKGGAEGGTLI
jgi:hypothetical protein